MKGVTKEQQTLATELSLKRAAACVLTWIAVTGPLETRPFKTLCASWNTPFLKLSSPNWITILITTVQYCIQLAMKNNIKMTYNDIQCYIQWHNNCTFFFHFIVLVIIFLLLPFLKIAIVYCFVSRVIAMVINFYLVTFWKKAIVYCINIME